jgi:hypothetical protein
MPGSPRDAVVESLKRRLSAESYPRLTVLASLIASGAGAGLFSVLTLRAGFTSMPARYACASMVGYAAFLGCIRLWIAWERRLLGTPSPSARASAAASSRIDAGDLIPDLDLSSSGGRVASEARVPALFAGGRSGGAGGGAQWAAVMPPPAGETSPVVRTGGSSFGNLVDGVFDGDAVLWLIVAAVAAFGGVLALGWIVYVAPAMLAEVALDAALVSTAYRQIRRQDLESWTTAVVRRTWVAATVLVTMTIAMGWALEKAAPGAHSMGAAIQTAVHRGDGR